jgi:threonine/homoserine/homoserine lactone efflux protein
MNGLFAIGFAAGLALAIPVGPMALLLVSTTIERGWRHGAVGALGMAVVDGCYAAVVFFVGASIAGFLNDWHLALGLIGAAILLSLSIQLLIRSIRVFSSDERLEAQTPVAGGLANTFAKFVSATIVNPATAFYFLAIAPSVSALASKNLTLQPVAAGLIFAIAVLCGSLIWQESLALAGSSLRKITTPRFRASIGLVGSVALLTMSIGIAASAFAA